LRGHSEGIGEALFPPSNILKVVLTDYNWPDLEKEKRDCVEPRKLYEAIHEGTYVAWKI